MVSYYDYFSVFLPIDTKHAIVIAKAIDGDDPKDYPAVVYDINGNQIGIASGKTEFIQIWNANTTNAAIGKLDGWYGPFAFQLITKQNVSIIKSDSSDELDFVVDSDGQIIEDADGIYII